MYVTTVRNNPSEIRKHVFSLKPVNSDGLVLQVNHTVLSYQRQPLRFVHATFNKSSNALAAGDPSGNIFIMDLLQNKFWFLGNLHVCTVLKFSTYGSCLDIVVGASGGKIVLLNTETGDIHGELIGHTRSIKHVSFALDHICLSVSEREAILWDLQNNGKLQVLNVDSACSLRLAVFMPLTNNILASFDDDSINIWRYGTYEIVKQILPRGRNKRSLKSIAFTRNGRAMVLSGHSSQLTVYMLDTWTILRVITLPDSILSVRNIEFLPQLFDGGSNRILTILAGNGVIYFYDMEQMLIINQLTTEEEITKFECSLDGKYISCILRSGEINIYRLAQYVPSLSKVTVTKEKNKSAKSVFSSSKNSLVTAVRNQIKDVLDINKLQSILKEFGEYPDSYRVTIWTQLLELPNNQQQYNHFINHATQPSFENLTKDYPLENKSALKNLRKLLQNLVTWSPFFDQVTYLPVLVFPFVKVFQNEPVLCFEAITTIILNWCQHWFEYFPLPPLNILAIIENVLLEHDPDLLKHFTYNSITTKEYAWPLLETVFSEVLTVKEWCILWDHIFTNEPAFLLMSVPAYIIINHETLLAVNDTQDMLTFFHTQNVIDIRRLISKTHALLNSTSVQNHPRRYLHEFRTLGRGSYASFKDFPKSLFSLENNEFVTLKEEQKRIEYDECEIMKEREKMEKLLGGNIIEETEAERLAVLEAHCRQKVKEERQHILVERKRLLNLRRQLHQKEIDMLNNSRKKISEKNSKEKGRILENILHDVEESRVAEELEIAKAESDLIKHYSDLLFQKIQIQEMLPSEQSVPDVEAAHYILKQQQRQLVEELEKLQMDASTKDYLKQLNVATSIAAMDDLILRIQAELVQQAADQTSTISKKQADMKVLKLEAETKELEFEVTKLLSTLTNMRENETKKGLIELNKSSEYRPSRGAYRTKTLSNDIKNKTQRVSSIQQDFMRLKNIIRNSRNLQTIEASLKDSQSEELATINLESLS